MYHDSRSRCIPRIPGSRWWTSCATLDTAEPAPAFAGFVFETGHLRVYSLPGREDIVEEEVGENRHAATVELDRPRAVELPLHYNPHWQAELQGQAVTIEDGPHGLAQVHLDEGISTLTFRFEKTWDEVAAWAVSALTALGLLLAGARGIGARRRE